MYVLLYIYISICSGFQRSIPNFHYLIPPALETLVFAPRTDLLIVSLILRTISLW